MLAFGTYKLSKNDAYTMALKALQNGYRYLDTAELYKNEESVQKAIVDSGISREEIFLSTKISTKNPDPKVILKSARKRLRIFGKIDLLLLHWPSYDILQGWRTLCNYQKDNSEYIKNIGISNISHVLLEEIVEGGLKVPDYIQNEINPYCYDVSTLEYSRKKGIKIMAHSIFMGNEIFDQCEIKNLSKKYNLDIDKLILSWLRDKVDIMITNCGLENENFLIKNINFNNSNEKGIEIKFDKIIRKYYYR